MSLSLNNFLFSLLFSPFLFFYHHFFLSFLLFYFLCTPFFILRNSFLTMRTSEFINPCTDSGFKRLFLYKETLILFLNSILPVEVAEVSQIRVRSLPSTPSEPRSEPQSPRPRSSSNPSPVLDIQYEPTELLGVELFSRLIRYDILCVSKDKKMFIVEMQMASETYFLHRMHYYSSRLISERQGWRGKQIPVS